MPSSPPATHGGTYTGGTDPRDLMTLVQNHLSLVSETVAKRVAPDQMLPEDSTVTSGIGDYLILTSQAWCNVLDRILESPELHQAIISALEESKARSHCADLSVVAAMDVEISKLKKMATKLRALSSEIEEVWVDSETHTFPRQLSPAVVNEIEKSIMDDLRISPRDRGRR